MSGLALHPLCELFPPLAEAEFNTLRDDIAANGQRSPIMLLDEKIIDGANRYRACLAAGVEPVFKQFDGGDVLAFVLSANLHRRHLSAGQQAAIVAAAQDWTKAHTHGGDRRSEQGAALPLARVADRASTAGASIRTQKMADQVARVDPALARQVAHGTVSLPKAVAQVRQRPISKKPSKAAQQRLDRMAATPPAQYSGSASPRRASAAQVAEDAHGDTDLVATLEELQKEVERLTSEVAAAEANDLKAEAMKQKRLVMVAQRAQAEAMDRVLLTEKREARTMRALRRCGNAVGEEDPDRIAAAVEAFVRQHREAA